MVFTNQSSIVFTPYCINKHSRRFEYGTKTAAHCILIYYVSLKINMLCNIPLGLCYRDAHLLHSVAVAYGDALVVFGLEVIGDAQRRAYLCPDGDNACLLSRRRHSRPQSLTTAIYKSQMQARPAFERGSTAHLTGASAGCRRSTTRESFTLLSSSCSSTPSS